MDGPEKKSVEREGWIVREQLSVIGRPRGLKCVRLIDTAVETHLKKQF